MADASPLENAATLHSSSCSASELYKDARYREAASEFHQKSRKRPRAEHIHANKVKKANLRALACQADALLCEVRSQLIVSPDYDNLCKDALEANGRYRIAVFVILQQLAVDESPVSERRRIAVLEALLLALVSASWLYLQTNKVRLARDVVVEDLYRMSPVLLGSRRASEETILVPLPEVLHRLGKAMPSKSIAWGQFVHTLRVLGFMAEGEGTKSPFPIDRMEACDDTSSSTALVDGSPVVELRVRELLLEVLKLDRQIQSDLNGSHVLTSRLRDQLLEQAVSIERSEGATTTARSVALRVQTLIHAVHATRGNGGSDIERSHRDLAVTLEKQLGRSFLSDAAGWNLLGCVKATYDVDGALKSFLQSHELDPARTEPVFNMAKCFLSVGECCHAHELLNVVRQMGASYECKRRSVAMYSLSDSSDAVSNGPLAVAWTYYLASTLEDDVAAQLEGVEDLGSKGLQTSWLTLSSAYSYLQCGSFRRTFRFIQKQSNKVSGSALESFAMDLYQAEAGIRGSDEPGAMSPLVVPSSEPRTKEKWVLYEGELSAVVFNNRGLSCLVGGRKRDALACFQQACHAVGRISPSQPGHKMSVFKQLFFNQALLLWTEKQVAEACDVWSVGGGIDWTLLTSEQLVVERERNHEEYLRFVSSDCSPDEPSRSQVARQDGVLLDLLLLTSKLHIEDLGRLTHLLQDSN